MAWASGVSFDPPGLGAGLTSPRNTSPTSTSPEEKVAPQRKRKRSSVHTDSGEQDGHYVGAASQHDTSSPNAFANSNRLRHQPGVKRACNDCRQQKLRCNVVAGPGSQYKPCDRCVKHKLVCSIDSDFKRLGKRAAHEEMVKELETCKAKLAEYEALNITLPSEAAGQPSNGSPASIVVCAPTAGLGGTSLAANEAAASRSLLDLSQGYRESGNLAYPSITPGTSMVTLGPVKLSDTQLQELYAIYFTSYHPWLPLLNPEQQYTFYWEKHPLLHWTIVGIAARRYESWPGLFMELQRPLEDILWTTLSGVPQAYHVCKALALLCTWPLPTSSTTKEPTMMLAGIMVQLALQHGLHRPSHAQDFSRFRVELREEDIVDRLNTWAAINIVTQTVSTGSGQPSLSRWAWYTYGLHLDRMKPELQIRCQIEKFCDTITRTLFTMQRDHVVETDAVGRGLQVSQFARDLGELETSVLSTSSSGGQIQSSVNANLLTFGPAIGPLFLKATALHLRLTAFFDKPSHPEYKDGLSRVYIAASSLLVTLDEMSDDTFLYVPRYVEQMMLAGACTLLKILNSFYAKQVDVVVGRTLFARTVGGLRKLSIRSNDLPQRLAEVMAQLWKSSGAAEQRLFTERPNDQPNESLQLKVRCRSSLSLLYDAIWRWRERAGDNGSANLQQAVENPTAIQTDRNTPQPGAIANVGQPMAPSHSLIDAHLANLQWDSFGGNAVFDPLSWALDGNLELGGQDLFAGSDSLSLGYPN